jgi:hypothetical protein
MSELFDRLVESAGQVISEVDKGGQIQSAIGGLRQRMAEAERKRKINQIKRQIRDLQSQEAQATSALSAQVLALYEAGTLSQPELVILCKGVDEIREQVKQSEAELEQYQPPPPEPVAEACCPSCGVTVVRGAAFCQTCGTALSKATDTASEAAPVQFCVHCGAQLRSGARFCPKCGQTVPSN